MKICRLTFFHYSFAWRKMGNLCEGLVGRAKCSAFQQHRHTIELPCLTLTFTGHQADQCKNLTSLIDKQSCLGANSGVAALVKNANTTCHLLMLEWIAVKLCHMEICDGVRAHKLGLLPWLDFSKSGWEFILVCESILSKMLADLASKSVFWLSVFCSRPDRPAPGPQPFSSPRYEVTISAQRSYTSVNVWDMLLDKHGHPPA